MKIKDVPGIITTGGGFYFVTITVRVSKDESGYTFSMAHDDTDLQLSVAYESIADMLEVEDGA